ncbi:exonuclease domain-containing protein [Nocardiopsis sp. NPDC050513]|uniref:3'-5' exonuclease n=1 Tax=Nocardiopsis sp. NPDC050513 TaxID=3364338 RepID=UPI00378A5FCE
MFTEGRLTRGPGADPRHLPFAAIAVKTTGYDPRRDRIYEVAVVRMRGDGTVVDEYATLVNPLRPVVGDDHDPVTDEQVQKAPTFDRIAGDLLAHLSGSVVVAHGLDHVDRFLDTELGRMGVRAPGVPGLCTLRLTRVQVDTYPCRQDNVYRLLTGEWPSWEASALDKARQRARMLHVLIGQSPVALRWNGPGPTALPALPRAGRIAPRALGLRMGSEGWLANLSAGLPDMNPSPQSDPQGVAEYRSMLGRALSDGRIVGDEAHRLALLVTGAGLCQATIRQVHEQVLLEARTRAEEDGVVTSAELRELEKAARNLGAGHLVQDLLQVSEQEKARRNGPLKGWRIVPVGESGPLEEVVEFAVGKGAVVGVNVTKTVRLVIAEDGSTDPKVARARAAGHQVVTPAEAWEVLRAAIERAETGLFDDGRGADVDARTRAEQERADLGNHRITVTAGPEPQRKKGGGCAGAALLFMATGTAVTTAATQLWPF